MMNGAASSTVQMQASYLGGRRFGSAPPPRPGSVYYGAGLSTGGVEKPKKRKHRGVSGVNTRGHSDHTSNIPFFYQDSKTKNFTPKKKGRKS